MAKKEPRWIDKKKLATALSTTIRTIARWQDEGMPVARRGRGGRPSLFDLERCRAWKQQQEAKSASAPGVSVGTQARAERDLAQAALARTALQIRMRELLPREEVEKAWLAESSAVRAILLTWETSLADKMYRAAITGGPAEVETVIHEAVRDVLHQLSDPSRPPGLPPTPGAAVAA